ncbi:hypothetical protein EQO05_04230 [Methanosarcina sp. MSH10X1]|uniref:WbqC family protein n=1 Tax=Methanosarcina sp. MSH10X1 TaxID=2507075 RepID=UPI000FFB4037|nr:WbqC family protein [Methanosarcina sp. MSH10X1]RXA20925.1 hypothetical protein EQO05_04230 [Methanosarcina sp. MSH10X1]
MIVAIHQPNHLPYLGFFDKVLKSDIFVIHDDAQFNDSDFQRRNRIRVYKGWKWITVPVERKEIPINKIMIKNDVNIGERSWNRAHFEIIQGWYKNAPYFETYKDDLRKIYESKHDKLANFNIEIIKFLIKAFDLEIKIVFSSDFNLPSKKTERIIDTVRAVGGDTYLSGPAGKDYMDLSLFKDIELQFQNFKHPEYPQCYAGFVPNMSAIDALFNVGKLPMEY